jgi:hypothetical protein
MHLLVGSIGERTATSKSSSIRRRDEQRSFARFAFDHHHLNPISYAPELRRHASGIWLLCTSSTMRSIDTLITAAVGT